MASPYTSFLASHGLVGCIDRPTRPSSGTCIDHIWAGHYPLSFLLKNSVFETFMLADHFPVILSINTGSNLNNSLSKNTFLRRIFDSYNFGGVSSVLQEQDWGCVLQETDPDAAYSIFETVLFELYDRSFPPRIFTKQNFSSPWYNNFLRKLRRNLDKLHKRFRALNTPLLKRT